MSIQVWWGLFPTRPLGGANAPGKGAIGLPKFKLAINARRLLFTRCVTLLYAEKCFATESNGWCCACGSELQRRRQKLRATLRAGGGARADPHPPHFLQARLVGLQFSPAIDKLHAIRQRFTDILARSRGNPRGAPRHARKSEQHSATPTPQPLRPTREARIATALAPATRTNSIDRRELDRGDHFESSAHGGLCPLRSAGASR